jgi:hypothetical protein
VQEINAVEHLSASRARDCLGDAKELLVDLLIDPRDFGYVLVVELCKAGPVSKARSQAIPIERTRYAADPLNSPEAKQGDAYDLEVHRRPAKSREAQMPALTDSVPQPAA